MEKSTNVQSYMSFTPYSSHNSSDLADLPPSYADATETSAPTLDWPNGYHNGAANHSGPSNSSNSNPWNSYSEPRYGAPFSISRHPRLSPNPTSGSPGEELVHEALQFTDGVPPPPNQGARLPKPIVIPQAADGIGQPFVRACSPALESRGVPLQAFVEFIDNLNVVATKSPPLQVLDLAGGIVGMVPLAIPQLVGNALSLTAKVSAVAVSKGRSTIFLKEANQTFFAPRGLKVELVTSRALKAKLGMNADAPLVSALEGAGDLNVQARRMRALENHVAPLTFNVPQPTQQTNALEQLSAGQVSRQIAQADKKALKNREKALEKTGRNKKTKADEELEKELEKIEKDRIKVESEYQKEMRKIQKDLAKTSRSSRQADLQRDAEKMVRKQDSELEKIDEDIAKALRKAERETSKDRREHGKKDKEAKMAEKVLWLMIEDLDA